MTVGLLSFSTSNAGTLQTVSSYPGIFTGTVYPISGNVDIRNATPKFSNGGGGVIASGVRGNLFSVMSISSAVNDYYLFTVDCTFLSTYTGSPTAGFAGFQLDGILIDGCDASGVPNGLTYQNVTSNGSLYWKAGILAGTHNLGYYISGDTSQPYIANKGNTSIGSATTLITPLGIGLPKEPAGSRDPTIYPGSSFHYYNRPVGTGAVASLLTDADQVQLTAIQGGNINVTSFSSNIYVGQSSDPVQNAACNDTFLTPLNPSPWHMPAGMVGSPSDPADLKLGLLDKTQTRWGVSGFGGSATAANPFPANPGLAQVQQSLMDHYNGFNHSITQGDGIFGIIREEEVLAGAINHVLICSLQEGNLKNVPNQFLGLKWPAAQCDFDAPTTYTGAIDYGARLYIPSSVNVSTLGLSAGGLILAKCLQNYGATIQITQGGPSGGPLDFSHISNGPGNDNTLMNQMITDLVAIGSGGNNLILPHLRILRNDGPNSIGGGGTPLVPLLPGVGVLTG